MPVETLSSKARVRSDPNRLQPEDRAIHDWYRFVLSFPPHLVRTYLSRFGMDASATVLDPFCGTGTTLVECKKLGIGSVGIEPNSMAWLASSVKIDWLVDPVALSRYANRVATRAKDALEKQGIGPFNGSPLFSGRTTSNTSVSRLPPEQEKLLLKNSISPMPLHKTLALLKEIDRHGNSHLRRYGRLALANALVNGIGNLKFGPEVGIGKIRQDAPVIDMWHNCMKTFVHDLHLVKEKAETPAEVIKSDSRAVDQVLKPKSVDAIITSPPYPNEKDYTRTTRLESVVLGLIRDRKELRALKQNLVRSNTRGVYKSDTDDEEIVHNARIREIADAIEKRRVELNKTSGFERMYPRVTKLYFGGMSRHLASLRSILKPGARLAYVVGDQASYLRVMIRTGQLLAELAEPLGYRVTGIDLFRTRSSTVTGQQLREEVLLLEWPGN